MLSGAPGFFRELSKEGPLLEDVESAMADIALVFKWGPTDFERIESLAELGRWHEKARERWYPEEAR